MTSVYSAVYAWDSSHVEVVASLLACTPVAGFVENSSSLSGKCSALLQFAPEALNLYYILTSLLATGNKPDKRGCHNPGRTDTYQRQLHLGSPLIHFLTSSPKHEATQRYQVPILN